jgi:transposase
MLAVRPYTFDVHVVRSYLRLRDTLSKDCNSLVQRMQKALTEMNIQVHRVIRILLV